mmetsp:Transcript_87214/g.121000  ORF Transcript_87214/g.121000 Transcript_87214/m.121000 type:complete len:80 (-) Transcript_87214:506-745(-)
MLLFMPIIPDDSSLEIKGIYFCACSVLYSIGFSGVMVMHMSFVPAVTCSRKRRDLLNQKRNTFTFIAQGFVLSIAILLF